MTDNELAYLESIHLFVEVLDHFFNNVCELDLVFNFHKVYMVIDEFILAAGTESIHTHTHTTRLSLSPLEGFDRREIRALSLVV